jgi:RNA polymerase sigma-70 factor, ECF subfamily
MSGQQVIRATTEQVCPRGYAREAVPGDDRSFVAQATAGYPHAFGELYERHRSKTYRIVFRILRNRQDSEDAVQRAFQRAFINLHKFRGESTFSTWITRIAMNEALMLLRQRRKMIPLSTTSNETTEAVPALDLRDEHPTPERALAETELHTIVRGAISRLRLSLRSVVVLHELQGLSSVETAQRLGLSVGAVKARLFHARRHLRQRLEREHRITRAVNS